MRRILYLVAISFALTLPVWAQADFQTNQRAIGIIGQADFSTSGATSGVPDALSSPEGVAQDPTTGKIFVSDGAHHRVLRFSSAAAKQLGANPEAVIGQANFSGTSRNQGGSASARSMNRPYGITVDSQGRLWVADDRNNRVLGYLVASSLGNNAPADIVLGQPDFTTTSANITSTTMRRPRGVSLGPNDTLWVADSFNNRVLGFKNVTDKSSGAAANSVFGNPDFGPDPSTALSSSQLNEPYALYADPGGRLWVGDTFNRRVLRFDAADAKALGAAADAVIGQPDFGTDTGGGPTATAFGLTYGVYFDDEENVWVGDFSNGRVIRFPNALSIAAGGTADIVLGAADLTTDASIGAPTAQSVRGPSQINFDSDGGLLIADYTSNRIIRFEKITPAAPPPPPAPAPTASISILGKKKVFTSAKRIRIRGRSEGAASIQYKAKRGGFKPLRGKLNRWKVVLRLKSRRTVFKVRAANADGVSTKIEKAIILRR